MAQHASKAALAAQLHFSFEKPPGPKKPRGSPSVQLPSWAMSRHTSAPRRVCLLDNGSSSVFHEQPCTTRINRKKAWSPSSSATGGRGVWRFSPQQPLLAEPNTQRRNHE